MRQLLYIFILLAVSCSTDTPSETITPSDKVEAKIVPDQASRAVVNGGRFDKGSNVGVFLYRSDGTTAHTTDAHLNIRTVYDSFKDAEDNEFNQWVYFFNYSLSVFHSCITLDKDDGTAKCYAYYPHSHSGTNPEAIPVTLSSQSDVMYARNESVEMPGGLFETDVKIDLTFEHALSCINFNFQFENETQNTIRLEGMQFDADRDVMTEGILNIKEQTLTEITKASTFSPLWNYSAYVTITDDLTYGVLVPPTEEKVAYTVYLTLNGIKMQTPIEIPATTYVAGTSYTVNVTIGNYAKFEFDGISVDDEWVQSAPDVDDTHFDHTI